MRKEVKHNVRIGTIASAILGLVAVAGTVSVLAIFPGVSIALAPFLKKKKYKPRQAVERSVDSLVKQGLLNRKIEKDGTYSLSLTTKGKWEASIRGYLDKDKTQKKKKWDGVWRIIVFDVPEQKRMLRRELRRAVGLYGFIKLQQSVWVYPYPCDDFVFLVKRHLGVTHDVLYITANHIENDKWLRREFKLNQ